MLKIINNLADKISVSAYMMQISSMYIGHEEDFNITLFNYFQSKCPLGTGPLIICIWMALLSCMYIGHGEDAGYCRLSLNWPPVNIKGFISISAHFTRDGTFNTLLIQTVSI